MAVHLLIMCCRSLKVALLTFCGLACLISCSSASMNCTVSRLQPFAFPAFHSAASRSSVEKLLLCSK